MTMTCGFKIYLDITKPHHVKFFHEHAPQTSFSNFLSKKVLDIQKFRNNAFPRLKLGSIDTTDGKQTDCSLPKLSSVEH